MRSRPVDEAFANSLLHHPAQADRAARRLRSGAYKTQEMHAGRAVVTDVQGLETENAEVGLAHAALEHHDGPGREPAAGGELLERRLAEPLGIGRVEKGQAEGGTVRPGAPTEGGGVAAVHARLAEEAHGLDVLADRAARGLVGLHEQAEGRASRQGLETERPGAREECDDPDIADARGPGGVLQDVEDSLSGAVGRGPRGLAGGRGQAPTAKGARDDAQRGPPANGRLSRPHPRSKVSPQQSREAAMGLVSVERRGGAAIVTYANPPLGTMTAAGAQEMLETIRPFAEDAQVRSAIITG